MVVLAQQRLQDADELAAQEAEQALLADAISHDFESDDFVSPELKLSDGQPVETRSLIDRTADSKNKKAKTKKKRTKKRRSKSSKSSKSSRSSRPSESSSQKTVLADGSYNPEAKHLDATLDDVELGGNSGTPLPGDIEMLSGGGAPITRTVAVVLSGSLGRTALSPNDHETIGILNAAFRKKISPPMMVVGPESFTRRASEAAKRPLDSSESVYRLTISASAGSAGGMTFYGKQIGKKYRSTLQCRLEQIVGDRVVLVRQFTVKELITPASTRKQTSPVRTVYNLAVQKLGRALSRMPEINRGARRTGTRT